MLAAVARVSACVFACVLPLLRESEVVLVVLRVLAADAACGVHWALLMRVLRSAVVVSRHCGGFDVVDLLTAPSP